MVGGDHVTQQRQNPRAGNIADHAGGFRHAAEIRRVLDIGGGGRPIVGFAVGRLHRLPFGVALEHIGIFLDEGGAGHRRLDQFGDFGVGGPDVLQIDMLATGGSAKRCRRQINVDITRQRVGHHQGRRGEVVGPHIRGNSPLEVAVARQHGGGHQIAFVDRGRNRRIQRAGIADAGGAAVAHEVETNGVKIFLQPGSVQIFRHHLAARGKRGFHPGFAGQAKRAGLAGHKTGGNHHIGIRGVGAGGDRGNHDRAIAQGVGFAGDRGGREAVETARHQDRFQRPAFVLPLLGLGGGGSWQFARCADEIAESLGGLGQGQKILRAFRAGNGRDNGAHVQVQRRGIDRRIVRPAPHAVGFGIGLDQRHARLLPPGIAQVTQGFIVDGKEAAGGAIFGGHIGDGGTICQRQAVQPVAPELHEFANHAVLAQHLHHFQHQIGCGCAFAHAACQLEADHLGDQHRNRLAQHRRLGLDTAHTPAEDRQAIDHGGMTVGAHQRIGVGNFGPGQVFVGPDGLGKTFEIDLMADAGARRYHPEIVKGLLSPL